MKFRNSLFSLLLLGFSLLVVSCSGMAPASTSLVNEIQAQGDDNPSPIQEPTATSGSTEGEAASLEATGNLTVPLPPIVLGRADMRASDPSTVVIASGEVQLVEFFAYWCAVCKAVAPTVHGLEDIYGEQINFVYLDRDDPATFALQEQLGYVYQPHFFLLAPDGSVLFQWTGYIDGLALQEALVASLNN